MLVKNILIPILLLLALFLSSKFNSPLLVNGSIFKFRKLKEIVFKDSNENLYLEVLGDEKFKKPLVSDKKFRFIKLKNDLKVFLISQSNSRESFAKMAVKVGDFKSPNSLPGMAHYLEHLLFINTESYPELDGFIKFTAIHNGYTNAYTSDTKTVYLFNTDSSSFEEGLARFSEFFKSPLFDNTYTEKELMAIENEFNYHKNSQEFRSLQVLFELLDERSLLYKRFICGNLETLKTVPNSQGINTRDEVIKFYKKEYSSNRMVLVLASNHALDELNYFADKYFSSIENKNLPVNSINIPIQDSKLNPFKTMIKKLILIDSLDEFTRLNLIFPMKEYMIKYISKDRLLYLEKLIISDRPGSLSHYLKSKKLIFNVYSTIYDNNLGFTNVEITFVLSKTGEKNIPFILSSFFSVIKFASVNNFSKEIYDENKRMLDNYFKYGDSLSIDTLSEVILNNHLEYDCKPEDVLYRHIYRDEFDPIVHQEIISQLIPENLIAVLEHFDIQTLINSTDSSKLNYFCNSNSFKEIEAANCDDSNYGIETLVDSEILLNDIRVEKFIKNKYLTKPLNSCLLSLLSNVTHVLASEKYGITLPTLNPYIPNDFSNNLIGVDEEEVPIRLPEAIKKFQAHDNNNSSNYTQDELQKYNRFFYYPTKNITSAKSIIQFRLIFPLDMVTDEFSEFSSDTVGIYLLFKLFSSLLQKQFSKHFHELESAQYSTSIDISLFVTNPTKTNQLIFKLFGFTDRIEEIVSDLQVFVSNFLTYITNSDFLLEKESLITDIKSSISNPDIFDNISYIYNKLFLNQEYSLETQLSRLEMINFYEILHFSKFFLNNCRLEGFLLGNLNPIQSLRIIDKFSSAFLFRNGNSSTKSNANLISSIVSGYKKSAEYFSSFYSFLSGVSTKEIENQDQEYFKFQKHLKSSSPILGSSNSIENLQIIDPLSLEKGSKIYYYYVSKSKSDINSTVLMKVIVGYNNLKNYILTTILTSIISDEFFTEIRTIKQLGYIVNAKQEDISNHISGIKFLTTSSNKNIQILTENILEFWNKWFSTQSNRITEVSFNTAKRSYIETLKNPLINMMEIFNEFSSEIETKTYDFNWRNSIINYADKLTYQEFFDWFKTIYNNSNIFLYAAQSANSEESDVLNNLSNFIPQNFTKFNPTDSLFNHKNIRTYNQWNTYNAF